MLRPEFVRRKLQLITADLARLRDFEDMSYEELVGDYARLATVERLLERIVMRAIDVNQHILTEKATGEEQRTTRLTYRDTFLQLTNLGVYSKDFADEIAPSAGLRNVLVHGYNDLDHRLLHAAIGTCLLRFPRYVQHVEAYLSE